MNTKLSRLAPYGGQVPFGGGAARVAAGDYSPFVVWFNFLAGLPSKCHKPSENFS